MGPDRFGVFGYPFGGGGRERPLVAGWVLVLSSVLVPVLPLIPFVGYLVRVVDASSAADPAPRFFADPRRLARESLAGSVVCVCYLLPPMLALLVTVYGAITRVSGPNLDFVENVVLYGGSTAVLTAFLVGFFLVPVGFAVTARHGLRAAFSLEHVRPIAGHAAYFSRWMAGAVTVVMTGALASVALQITRVGPVVAALVVAYGTILAAHIWGQGVRYARRR